MLLLAFSFINYSMIHTVQAKEFNYFQAESDQLVWHDISELNTLPIEETYTYDEMYNKLLNNGYTVAEVKKLMGEKQESKRAATEIRYSLFRMKIYSYGTYKLQARFHVGLEYNKGAYAPNKIVHLQAAHIYTGDKAKCLFKGKIFYRLERGNRFYYNFYGDIYRAGTINWSLGIKVGIGGAGEATATISNGSGFIKNVSESETYHAGGLRP